MKKLYVVGIGPGSIENMTLKAYNVIKECDVIVGYTKYLDMIKEIIEGKELYSTGMRSEEERCRLAIKLAKEKNRPYDINLQIRKKLKDRAIFYKIDKEKAYQILLNVGVAEDMLIETYIKLVNREKYDYLVITGKINPNDNDIIIKF